MLSPIQRNSWFRGNTAYFPIAEGMTRMPKSKKLGFNTRAIHEIGPYDGFMHDSLNPPIFMTSTFSFESAEEAALTFAGEKERFVYSRVNNPTQAVLEARIASLEGAEAAVALASGMGAISALFWSNLRAGDEVIAHCRMYGNTFTLLTKGLAEFGLKIRLVDFCETGVLERTLNENTKIVFFETPSNPLLEIIDIRRVAEAAHTANALCVVDSTLASPALQRPLEMGADLVVHSMTKYLGGHGDLLGGVVVGARNEIKNIRMRGLRYLTGATLSPVSAHLILRGIQTLGLRIERHCANACVLAKLLQDHPKIARVIYPGLESHPQYDLARQQMSLPGGLISLELKDGLSAGRKFIDALTLATRAVSLGDTGTLVQHPASMTHAGYGTAELLRYGLSEGLIRISVGLEDVADIIDDLQNALDKV